MAEYTKLVSYIIENVGGKENVENVTHCVTRLRFKLKDDTNVNEKALIDYKGILTAQHSGGKYQVVIGTHVPDVYEEVLIQLGNAADQEEVKVEGSILNRLTATITEIMTPILGVLGGSGIILGVSAVLVAMGIIQPGDGTHTVLNALGYSVIRFFPVFLGYTSAKAFKMQPFVGMSIGAVMVFPGLTESMTTGDALYTIFEGTSFAMPVFKTFLGIPILFPANGYVNTVFPIIIANYFAAKVEKGMKKILPKVIQHSLVPFLTLLIAGPVSLLVIGPVANILNYAIAAGVSFLFDKSLLLSSIIISLIYQPTVVLGLHWATNAIGFTNLALYGSDMVIALHSTAFMTHVGACLAVYLRTKSNEMKNIALPAMFSAVFCTIEPSLYGVTLPVKKRFGFCLLGTVVGGLIIGLFHAPMYSMIVGITAFPAAYINPVTGDLRGGVVAICAAFASMLITFLLTYFTYKPGEDGKADEMGLPDTHTNNKTIYGKETLYSPMKGETKKLSEIEDKAFASNALGKGICIIPSEGKVVSPCDGTLTTVFPQGHAVGVTSANGAEILIHIGIDTVQLPEGIFKKEKAQGVSVKKGDLLLTFDIEKIKELGYSTETAVVLTNTDQYLDVIAICGKNVNYQEKLITTIGQRGEKSWKEMRL